MNALIDLFCWPGRILLPRAGFVNDEKESKLKKVEWIPKTVIFLVAISGTIYNTVNMPLTYGQKADPVSGVIRPVLFLAKRPNGQYMLEGMVVSLIILVGTAGLFLIEKIASYKSQKLPSHFQILMLIALLAAWGSPVVLNHLVTFKLGNYLK